MAHAARDATLGDLRTTDEATGGRLSESNRRHGLQGGSSPL